MSGNSLFLICQPCAQAKAEDYGVKLASRTQVSWYIHEAPPKQLDAWLYQHRNCAGRGHPDHFQLGLLAERDYDQQIDEAVKAAVSSKIKQLQKS